MKASLICAKLLALAFGTGAIAPAAAQEKGLFSLFYLSCARNNTGPSDWNAALMRTKTIEIKNKPHQFIKYALVGGDKYTVSFNVNQGICRVYSDRATMKAAHNMMLAAFKRGGWQEFKLDDGRQQIRYFLETDANDQGSMFVRLTQQAVGMPGVILERLMPKASGA